MTKIPEKNSGITSASVAKQEQTSTQAPVLEVAQEGEIQETRVGTGVKRS